MSKQDRQGVRKASDIEQKYDLSKLNNLDGYTNRQKEQLSKLMQTLSQFSVETNTKFTDQDEQLKELTQTLTDFISEIEEKFAELYPIGSVYVNLTNENPSSVYGGTWELMLEGKMVVGENQETTTTTTPELTLSLDTCYIWKRIS